MSQVSAEHLLQRLIQDSGAQVSVSIGTGDRQNHATVVVWTTGDPDDVFTIDVKRGQK